MRSNRRRNWLIRRIALGFAVAAVAAPVAQAKVDEGSSQSGTGYTAFVSDFPSVASSVKAIAHRSVVTVPPSTVKAGDYGMPRALPSDYAIARGDQIELVRSQPRSTGSDIVAADYGMPRALPSDYALSKGDQIEVVRSQPKGSSSDKIEFVRSQPRSTGPELVASSTFNWDDAAGGAGLALALVLLGGGAALASRHSGRTQTA
jgi:hypothetical protein